MAEKVTERTTYAPIIGKLEGLGFEGVQEVESDSKFPDIVFEYNDEKFIVEVKIGEQQEMLQALGEAQDYSRRSGIENTIVLVFRPETRRPIVGKDQVDELILETEVDSYFSTKYINNRKKDSVTSLFKDLKVKIEESEREVADIEAIVDTLRESIELISEVLKNQTEKDVEDILEEVTGRYELFESIAEQDDEQEIQNAAIDMISYLAVNQILFYHIYRKETGNVKEIPLDISIDELSQLFEDEILEIDYEAIYEIRVTEEIPNTKEVNSALKNIISVIKAIEPENIQHDLLGRLFHELLPQKTRKTLAAFYTNPKAADLLTSLTIDDWTEKVIDPACGSGTLLVSSYAEKKDLREDLGSLSSGDLDGLHKEFVGDELYGSDIMPFATHLTALNLTSQRIETTTENMQVTVGDSLELSKQMKQKGGITIDSFQKTVQQKLGKEFEGEDVSAEGSVDSTGKSEEGFVIQDIDSIIMNPPFTDRNKMPKSYLNKLDSFSEIKEIAGGAVNLWGLFLGLSEGFLDNGGKIGAVIPINFARGDDTAQLREFLIENYHIRTIVKPVGDIAFSEDCDFRDIILIAEKGQRNKPTQIVYLTEKMENISLEDMKEIENDLNLQREGEEIKDGRIESYWVDKENIEKNSSNLMPFLSGRSIETGKILGNFISEVSDNTEKLTKIKKKWMREGFHASPAGLSQIVFVTRPSDESRTRRAHQILKEESDDHIISEIDELEEEFIISKNKVKPAIRTFTGFNRIEIGDSSDYAITEKFDGQNKIIESSKWKERSEFDWHDVQKKVNKTQANIVIPHRMRVSSDNSYLLAFYNEEKVVSPHSFTVFEFDNKDKCKIFALFLNSTYYIAQLFLNMKETTGGFTEIMQKDLANFDIFDYESLDEDEKEDLLKTFNEVKKMEVDPIIKQLEEKSEFRRKIDKSILETLNYDSDNLDDELSEVYEVLYEEFKALEDM